MIFWRHVVVYLLGCVALAAQDELYRFSIYQLAPNEQMARIHEQSGELDADGFRKMLPQAEILDYATIVLPLSRKVYGDMHYVAAKIPKYAYYESTDTFEVTGYELARAGQVLMAILSPESDGHYSVIYEYDHMRPTQWTADPQGHMIPTLNGNSVKGHMRLQLDRPLPNFHEAGDQPMYFFLLERVAEE